MRDLEEAASSDPTEMWKRIKKLSDAKVDKAVLEIVRADETICNDVKEVLARWFQDISRLYSGIRQNPEMVYTDDFFNRIVNLKAEFEQLDPADQIRQTEKDTTDLNSNITLEEVAKCIDRAKAGK